MRTGTVILALILLSLSQLHAAQDLAYGPAERHKLDVYTPENGSPAPVVLWIHGGAWKFGDKAHVQSKPAWLTGEGWALVAMNYRFVPQVTWREEATDVAAAVKWIQTEGAKHGLDATRIVLMGHSAGAHLAALVATDEQYFKQAEVDSSAIVGVVLIDGAGYDVARQAKFAQGWLGNVYDEVFSTDVKQQHDASPVRHVHTRDRWPRFLILHCANRVASTQQAKLLGDAISEAGGKGTIYAAEGKNHMTVNRELGTPEDEPTDEINEFLRELASSTDSSMPQAR
jgi:arylformamidase